MIVEVSSHWPFVRAHRCVPMAKEVNEDYRHKTWVVLPDGRVGIIHHEKPDGSIAVRPINEDGEHYPNTSAHWSMADRLRIPEEVAIARNDVRAADRHEIPKSLR